MRTFVLDTVALAKILFFPKDLTRLGRAIVAMAEDFGAELVVPTFVLVEAMRVGQRARPPISLEQIVQPLMEAAYVRIEPLGTDQVLALPSLAAIRELHDRIICAHAITNDAPLMTTDEQIHESGLVETVW